jgi:hypothetical protein
MSKECIVVEAFISKEIQDGLDLARVKSLKESSRLRAHVDGKMLPVLKMSKTGFTTEAGGPALRGFVDLFDGSLHLFQCLIIAVQEENGEMHYEYKRATAVADKAALDFEKIESSPIGLLEGSTQRRRFTVDR